MKGNKLYINDPMPEFKNLPSVGGKNYSSSDFKDVSILVIVFSCNHCPYVIAYEDRIIELQKDYAGKGVQLVAINSNDEKNYPEDNLDEMVKRARQKGFNFKYLRDGDQRVAEAFGATHTPQFFVFNRERKLSYSGKMDDNWENPKAVKESYLRNALDALLTGKEVKMPETFSIGCTIKWRT
ncbi:MAG: thioredoxin family protein [Bacteroidota bacterium]|nr:thioredoxin family protein [Bacteroidota bacterium]